MLRERQKESDRPKTDARTADGEWRNIPGFITAIFFVFHARYQHYHNFTFVIGWHRASVTFSRVPFSFFFSIFLSFSVFLRLSFFSVCSLYFFFFTFSSRSFFLFFPSILSHFLSSFSPFASTIRDALFTRFWSLFVTPGIVPRTIVRLKCPMTIGDH